MHSFTTVGVGLLNFAKPTPKIGENGWFSVKKRSETSVFGVSFRCQVLASVSVSLSSLDRRSRFGPKTQKPVPVPVVNRNGFRHCFYWFEIENILRPRHWAEEEKKTTLLGHYSSNWRIYIFVCVLSYSLTILWFFLVLFVDHVVVTNCEHLVPFGHFWSS